MQKISLALGSVLLAAAASADPLAADRPGLSNAPSVVAPGAIQLEGGFLFERETDGGDPNTNTITVPEALLRVGLLSFLEIGFPWRVGDDLHGDISAGVGLDKAAPDFLGSAGATWCFSLH